MQPEISVVIPTYNRLARLRQVLDALTYQTFPADAFEVVVVSDGASDGTNEFLTSLTMPCALKTIVQDNQGVAAARNRGLAEAEAHRPFDLARGPLLRATLLRTADDDAVVLFTVHHVVSDDLTDQMVIVGSDRIAIYLP